MDKLKECPFCGSRNILLVRREESLFTDRPIAQLQCRDCYCCGAPCTDEEDPYKSWNHRTTPTPPAEGKTRRDFNDSIDLASQVNQEHIAGLVGALEDAKRDVGFYINQLAYENNGRGDYADFAIDGVMEDRGKRAGKIAANISKALSALPPELRVASQSKIDSDQSNG